MDSLENEKQRSLLDGSLLDDPLPVCNNSASPIYSPYHENEALTSPDPLASFTAVQPGSVRTFQVQFGTSIIAISPSKLIFRFQQIINNDFVVE